MSSKAEKSSKVLFIPRLPPSLSNWKLMKNHFSEHGNVKNVILNPQQRTGTVFFETEEDAENALQNGNVWKGKKLEIIRLVDVTKSLLDPRALNSSSSYSELDWDMGMDAVEEGKESFGVLEVAADEPSKKKRLHKTRSVSREGKLKSREIKKLENEKGDLKKSPIKPSRTRLISRSKMLSKDSPRKAPKTGTNRQAPSIIVKKLVRKSIKDMPTDIPEDIQENIDMKKELDLNKKLALLDERDKLIRKTQVQTLDSKLGPAKKVIVGTCPDMCPEKERIMREYRRLVSPYECAPNSHRMDPALAVKEYSRSSADQEEPLPHELRPEPVLSMTMAYLITNIMPLIEDPDVNVRDWYDFCWDRLRSIRKDIIQQQLCDLEIVTIIERCARFHICCYDRLWGEDPEVFDTKINSENLMNCLQALRHMYEDLGKEGVQCPNEGEFNAYLILLNMKTGDLLAEYQQFSPRLQSDEAIQSAVEIYLAYNNSMYSKFFCLVEKSTYLNACLLQRYFLLMRIRALQAIVKAYCPPKKAGTIPMRHMKRILWFDSREDTKEFCESHGLVFRDVKDEFKFFRQNFVFPKVEVKIKNSSSLVTEKRVPVLNAVIGKNNPVPVYVKHEVSNSFTSDSKLIETVGPLDKGSILSSKNIATSDADQEMDEYIEEVYSEDDGSLQAMAVQEMEEDVVELPAETHDLPKNKQIDSFDFGSEIGKFKFVIDKENIPKQTVEDSSTWGSNKTFGFLKPVEDVKHEKSESFTVPTSDVFAQRQMVSTQQSFSFVLPPKNTLDTRSEAKNMDELQPKKKKPVKEFKFKTVDEIFNTGTKPIVPNIPSPNTNQMIIQPSATENMDLVQSPTSILESKSQLFVGDNRFHAKPIGSSGFAWSSSGQSNKQSEGFFTSRPADKKITNLPINESKDTSSCKKTDSEYFEFYEDNLTVYEDISSDGIDFNKTEKTAFIETDFGPRLSEVIDKEEKKEIHLEKEEEEQVEKCKTIDDETMKKLKKDLRRTWKAVAARKCWRLWKQKVERIKQSRKDFPLMLYVPSEQHILTWGTLSGKSDSVLLHRVRENDRNLKIVTTILQKGLPNNIPFLGQEIAEAVVLKHKFVQKKDVNALLNWKLVISVPFDSDKKFIADKFTNWSKQLFYNSKDAVLGSATKLMSSLNLPVYYSAHIVTGNSFVQGKSNKLSGFNALIFVSLEGLETIEERIKRCKKLMSYKSNIKPLLIAVINIGSEEENKTNEKFVSFLNKEKLNGRIRDWIEERWIDISSIINALKFLTLNMDPVSEISVGTLSSVVKRLSESLFDNIFALKSQFPEFSAYLKKPECLINVYNAGVERLQWKLEENIQRDKNFIPPEFMEFVEVIDEPSLDFSKYTFSKAHKINFSNTIKAVTLPSYLLGRWPPKSHSQFFFDLKNYCQSIGCKELLPRIMRLVDLDEDEKIEICLENVPWVTIVEMWAKHVVNRSAYSEKKVVVMYNENDICDIVNRDWWLNLICSQSA